MKSRYILGIACLLAASTASAGEASRYDVKLPGDRPAVRIEGSGGPVSAKTYHVPSSSELVLKATRIRYDSAAQQTFLEGAASVSYDGQVVAADQIFLQRVERDGGAEVFMIAITGQATIRFEPKAG